MATANSEVCGNGDGSFHVQLTYDTATLLITAITYQNTTSQRGAVILGPPANLTVLLQPNTPTTTVDVSARNISMLPGVMYKGSLSPARPPVQVGCQWPA